MSSLQNASWRINNTDYGFVRQMSVLLSHKKSADYLQIRLLKSTYCNNNAAVIHMTERVLSVHYHKEFSSSSVIIFDYLAHQRFYCESRHVTHSVRETRSFIIGRQMSNRSLLLRSLSYRSLMGRREGINAMAFG